MNFCFDVDGPIIDVSDRYYRAYLESLKGYDINKDKLLSKEQFWLLKQNRISDLEIGLAVGLSLKEAKASGDLRRELTFKFESLLFDKIFDDVIKTFQYLKSYKVMIFLVTLRSRKEMDFALKQFKLNKYIDAKYVFPLEDNLRIQNDIHGKYLLLHNAMNQLSLNPLDTWLIGDSDTDIHAGRLVHCGKIIGIMRGIRSKQQLDILKPDYLINDLNELIALSNTVH